MTRTHHRNTAGQPYEDKAFPEARFIGQESPSQGKLRVGSVLFLNRGRQLATHTMKKGAISQFTTMLKATCNQSCFDLNTRCSVSYSTLHRIGYIMTSRPMATKSRTFDQ